MDIAWMTVEQIAARYGVKRGYVYRLACLHRWGRRRDADRRVRYLGTDVEATLAPGLRARRSARSTSADPA